MTRIEAILFDFDGTLAAISIDFPMMRRSILDIIVSYGIKPDGLADLFALEMVEAGREIIAVRDSGCEREYLRKTSKLIRDMEIQGAKEGRLFQETQSMLRNLRARGFKTGVVTRNCLDAITTIFPGIDRFCDTVVTRETPGRVKPHPDHLLAALDRLGTVPESAAVVGDHPMDIRSGKAAGVFTVGVLTGYGTAESLTLAGADLIVQSAAEILKHISPSLRP